eukprot:scaffold7775_cov61-Cyclotella_meneghiniana.AAC.20
MAGLSNEAGRQVADEKKGGVLISIFRAEVAGQLRGATDGKITIMSDQQRYLGYPLSTLTHMPRVRPLVAQVG